MEHDRADRCPMCGSLMGAEARPAAMKKAAEIQDQIDQLERRMRDAEGGSWTITVAVVCAPCRHALGGAGDTREVAAALQMRISELSRELVERMPRSA